MLIAMNQKISFFQAFDIFINNAAISIADLIERIYILFGGAGK